MPLDFDNIDLSKCSSKIEVTCDYCGKLFTVYRAHIRANLKRGYNRFFDSRKCRARFFSEITSKSEDNKKAKQERALKRFWSFVEKSEDETECWKWSGRLIYGYGYFFYQKRPYRAHIFSYEIHIGTIPEELIVRHTCHNRSCCNPKHLILGTNKDNSNDMVEADRQAKGSHVGTSKMDENMAAKIKYMYHVLGMRQCEIRDLLEPLGISQTMVQTTCTDKWWRHVPVPDSMPE